MSETQINDSRASEILTAFLTRNLSVPELAQEFEIPLLTLLRWFESETIVRALEQIESLQRVQQTLAASAAAPRAVDCLLITCESDQSSPSAVTSAANSILRFAASATKPARTRPAPLAAPTPKPADDTAPANTSTIREIRGVVSPLDPHSCLPSR